MKLINRSAIALSVMGMVIAAAGAAFQNDDRSWTLLDADQAETIYGAGCDYGIAASVDGCGDGDCDVKCKWYDFQEGGNLYKRTPNCVDGDDTCGEYSYKDSCDS